VAPSTSPENLAPTIAIAWKDSPGSRASSHSGAPLLQKAERIVVLTADEGSETIEEVASARTHRRAISPAWRDKRGAARRAGRAALFRMP
jgi:hypothetical protein